MADAGDRAVGEYQGGAFVRVLPKFKEKSRDLIFILTAYPGSGG